MPNGFMEEVEDMRLEPAEVMKAVVARLPAQAAN